MMISFRNRKMPIAIVSDLRPCPSMSLFGLSDLFNPCPFFWRFIRNSVWGCASISTWSAAEEFSVFCSLSACKNWIYIVSPLSCWKSLVHALLKFILLYSKCISWKQQQCTRLEKMSFALCLLQFLFYPFHLETLCVRLLQALSFPGNLCVCENSQWSKPCSVWRRPLCRSCTRPLIRSSEKVTDVCGDGAVPAKGNHFVEDEAVSRACGLSRSLRWSSLGCPIEAKLDQMRPSALSAIAYSWVPHGVCGFRR